ncbi:MAG: T9SS type A sorting domain-containing protein [Bacteroidales bacterium]|nr:T9SS type A sorting domain-containing protein [Bacteroidales bacterium]
MSIEAYDVYFDKPVTVDSVFYIGGTANSNVIDPERQNAYLYRPTHYASRESAGGCCQPTDWALEKITVGNRVVWGNYHYPNVYGFYLPIVDNDSLSVVAANGMQGHTLGAGYHPHGHTIEFSAVPNEGFAFSHWSDGDTNNPRQVLLMQDTTFVAYFDSLDTPNAIAQPADAQEPLLTVSPNPTRTELNVGCEKAMTSITLSDASGRTVLQLSPNAKTATFSVSHLPAGVYLLSVRTHKETLLRKVVVE